MEYDNVFKMAALFGIVYHFSNGNLGYACISLFLWYLFIGRLVNTIFSFVNRTIDGD